MNERTQTTSDPTLKPLYARSVVNSFGSGAVSPFLSVYAVQLGASASDMGWFQSITNLSPSVMQIPWGELSDRMGRRVPFLLVGGLITAFLWIPVVFVTSAKQLIVWIAVQSILGSMAIPTWTALIADLIPLSTKGAVAASLNRWAAVGSLGATLLSGYLMFTMGGTPQQILFIPFCIAIVCGAVSSLIIFYVKEKPHPRVGGSLLFGVVDVAKQMKSVPYFSRYCLVSVIFGFFMSVSWPLFSITLVHVLGASMLEVALLSVIEGAIVIAFQPWAGRLVDRIGRKALLIITRMGLVLVPLFYAFTPHIYCLFVLNSVLGVLTAFGNTAMLAYQLDVTPEEYRGSFTAFYNLTTGITYFVGCLVGGYLSDYLLGIVGIVLAIQIVYVVSAVGRAIGALTYISIREPYEYPSTLKRELLEVMQKIPH